MEDNIVFKSALSTALLTNKYRKISLIVAFTLLFFVIILGLTPYPDQMKNVEVIFLFWFISSFPFGFLLKKQKKVRSLNNLYLAYNFVADFLFMTLILYHIGGAEWMGAIFYLFPIVYTNNVLPKEKGVIVSTMGSVYYTALVVLQYFELIPFKSFYPLGVKLYQNPKYLLFTLPFVWFAFHFIGRIPSIFNQMFKNRTLELEKAKLDLEKAKDILDIKVKVRTKQLEELTESLEEKVKQRTKELQQKVGELEKFKGFAVGRELKMTELKKEINKLRQELEEYKKKE